MVLSVTLDKLYSFSESKILIKKKKKEAVSPTSRGWEDGHEVAIQCRCSGKAPAFLLPWVIATISQGFGHVQDRTNEIQVQNTKGSSHCCWKRNIL